jgi:hypothetical protein
MFDYAIFLFILVVVFLALYAMVLTTLEIQYLKEVKRFEKITEQQELLALKHLQE